MAVVDVSRQTIEDISPTLNQTKIVILFDTLRRRNIAIYSDVCSECTTAYLLN